MVHMYYKLVGVGYRTMELVEGKIQVPEEYRAGVQLLLDKDKLIV
ncbi:CD1375 family protein [Clostridium estertheticum]|nr:CD1375 family protein [Clostridium estertheticum]